MDHEADFKLEAPSPFSFAENLSYLSRADNECMYRIQGGCIIKALPLGRETPIVEISADEQDTLLVRFLGDTAPASGAAQAAALSYVRDWFDLDTNLLPFYELAGADPLLSRATQSFRGLRIMGIPDLFEAICWGIIGQQINLTFAYTLKRRLVEQFGRRIDGGGDSHWLFPEPETIAGLTVNDLDDIRMTGKKCEYMIGVARLIAEGKLSKELLVAAGGFKQAENMLVGIRGIGPWTANYVLMRCLRMPSAFPIDDVGLHNAIKLLRGMDRKPTKPELLQLSANWSGWESYATFYLWRFLY